MKLKTSCFEPAISHAYWKRFAPLSALYTIGIVVLTVGRLNAQSHITAAHCVQSLCYAAVACNLVYAAVAAQLLAGDLYTPRLSYAIHALPITMGGWFGTQVILGILSVLPGILLSGIAMAMLLTAYRLTIVIWMICALLSFLFFYGTALLSSVCSGNRLGMLLIYGILNFAGLFIQWARIHIFGSLIYGLYIPSSITWTIPYAVMVGGLPFDLDYSTDATEEILAMSNSEVYFSSAYCSKLNFSSNLWFFVLYAVIGCALIGLAAYLLHKRKPECAGDLLAFRVTEPVILVVSALFCGIVAHVVSYYMGFDLDYPLLFVGIVLGYYVALMLLKRQVNVFTRKSLPALVILLTVTAASLVATGLDAFGITYKVPQADEVSSVSVELVSFTSYSYGYGGLNGGELVLTDSDDIAEAIALQEECLDDHRQTEAARPLLERIFGNEETYVEHTLSDGTRESSGSVRLCYTMKDGSVWYRSYTVYASFDSTALLQKGYSAPKYVFSSAFLNEEDELDKEALLESLRSIELIDYGIDEEGMFVSSSATIDNADASELLDALLEDCAAYATAQASFLHDSSGSTEHLYVYTKRPGTDYISTFSIYIYSDCANTIAFLESHGYYDALEPASSYY